MLGAVSRKNGDSNKNYIPELSCLEANFCNATEFNQCMTYLSFLIAHIRLSHKNLVSNFSKQFWQLIHLKELFSKLELCISKLFQGMPHAVHGLLGNNSSRHIYFIICPRHYYVLQYVICRADFFWMSRMPPSWHKPLTFTRPAGRLLLEKRKQVLADLYKLFIFYTIHKLFTTG